MECDGGLRLWHIGSGVVCGLLQDQAMQLTVTALCQPLNSPIRFPSVALPKAVS